MFVTIQSQSHVQLLVSATILVAMTMALPRLFRAFARRILPFAPNSEFAFLVIVALVCSAITRQLGVYYLVGAFVVGVTARRFGEELPAVASKELLRSVELFASFFIPFYFFKAGLRLTAEDFGWRSIGLGALFVVVAVPVRVMTVALVRARAFERPLRLAARVGISLVPTLVFTLVIANILREQFSLPPALYGALVVYALATTIIPGVVLGAAQEYDQRQSLITPRNTED
jgi:Kef-type K+ transport system membrane component KefB